MHNNHTHDMFHEPLDFACHFPNSLQFPDVFLPSDLQKLCPIQNLTPFMDTQHMKPCCRYPNYLWRELRELGPCLHLLVQRHKGPGSLVLTSTSKCPLGTLTTSTFHGNGIFCLWHPCASASQHQLVFNFVSFISCITFWINASI